jgi:hypothetical protein
VVGGEGVSAAGACCGLSGPDVSVVKFLGFSWLPRRRSLSSMTLRADFFTEGGGLAQQLLSTSGERQCEAIASRPMSQV